MIIEVSVKPNARSTEIKKISEPNIFQVSVTTPATEGKANLAVVDVLAKYFKIPKRQVALKHGTAGKRKLFDITTD
jgi:uncharacterized protein